MLDVKLQLKPGQTIGLVNSPIKLSLGAKTTLVGSADVVLVFAKNSSELKKNLKTLISTAKRGSIAWIIYPKAGQLDTDLNRDVLHKLMLDSNLKTVRQIAIDTTWSALRLKPQS